MTDEQLAGQVLVVSGHGSGGPLAAGLEPGGVIFVGRELLDEDGTEQADVGTGAGAGLPGLVEDLQARSEIPLLVMMDQEHGPVVRLGEPFTHFPSAMALGATGDRQLVRMVAAAAGQEMAVAGANVNLAPVADINTEPSNPVIGVRSPGEDPAAAAMVVTAMVRGLQEDAGIAAAVKHFPGHGATTTDSHAGLPTVGAAMDELRETALVPFEAAIDAGVEVVMPGHLLLPEVDPAAPATLSPELLQGLLRDQLGFDGVVLSDALNMDAIRRGGGSSPTVRALRAGVDLVLMPPDARRAHDAILAALADGTLDRDRLVEAVRRVLALKVRLGLLPDADLPDPRLPDAEELAEHRALAVRAGARAVTVLDGPCPVPTLEAVSVDGDDREVVAEALVEAGVTVTGDAATRLVLWDGRGTPPAAAGALVAVTGSPYAAGQVLSYETLLVTYDGTDATLTGLATALADGTFTATSPVTIPRAQGDALPAGHGIRCTPSRGAG